MIGKVWRSVGPFAAILLAAAAAGAEAPAPPATAPASSGQASKAAPPSPPARVMPPPAKTPPANPLEGALVGVVRIERNGRLVALGTLLSGDGRVITALSPLTHGNGLTLRYSNGPIVPVKVSHADRAWDLALLTPEGDERHFGLKASQKAAPAVGDKLHGVNLVNGGLRLADVSVASRSTLRGGDSAEIADALGLSRAPGPSEIGAPVLDDEGEVVAVTARACANRDKTGCTLEPYAAPVTAIRAFLRSVPRRPGPFLGLEVMAFDAGVVRGVRVTSLVPNSPASDAGLHAGAATVADTIVAVDGVPVTTSQAFFEAVESHTLDGPVRLLSFAAGRYREAPLFLRDRRARLGPERVLRSSAAAGPRPAPRDDEPTSPPPDAPPLVPPSSPPPPYR